MSSAMFTTRNEYKRLEEKDTLLFSTSFMSGYSSFLVKNVFVNMSVWRKFRTRFVTHATPNIYKEEEKNEGRVYPIFLFPPSVAPKSGPLQQ